MRTLRRLFGMSLTALACGRAPSLSAQLLAEPIGEKPLPMLVENAPATGTFYLLGRIPSPPFPFDPYRGRLPIYAYDGVFFVDDTQVMLLVETELAMVEEGGGMMLMSSPSPPGIVVTNSVTNFCCNTLTNFTVDYRSSTSTNIGIAQTTNPWIALTILTATTNASYDVFGTTNMVDLTLPSLGRTNWTWLVRASGSSTNFGWGLTNWCERYFQLGTMTDADSDGLTDAYEYLVSKTNPGTNDTDGDGLSDGWEVQNRLNPLLDDSGQTASRLNYVYDGAGRLKQVSGVQGKIVGIDAEGNILQLTQ